MMCVYQPELSSIDNLTTQIWSNYTHAAHTETDQLSFWVLTLKKVGGVTIFSKFKIAFLAINI